MNWFATGLAAGSHPEWHPVRIRILGFGHLGRGCLFIRTEMEEEEDKANAARPLMRAVHFLAQFWLAVYSSSHPPPLT